MGLFRQIMLLLVLLGLAGGGYVAYERWSAGRGPQTVETRRQGPQAVPVEVTRADLRRVERRVEAVGSTLARKAVEIVPLTSGRITEILFRPGDQVAAGGTLVRLDDEIERANLAEAEAKLAEAVLALERANTLKRRDAVTETTVQELTAKEASARAEVDRARRRLADRTIRAPFAGIVGLARVELGARVDDGTVITTLDDLSQIEIEFTLPEIFYGQIVIGQPIVADSAAFPDRKFQGRITAIDSRIGAVSRAFKARALMPNPDLVLPSGMFMHLAVVMDAREAVTVPEEAILAQGGENFVFIVDGDKAQRRLVTIGQRQFGTVEIAAGVRKGETVVTAGLQRLRDGAAVRLVPASGGGAKGGNEAGPANRDAGATGRAGGS